MNSTVTFILLLFFIPLYFSIRKTVNHRIIGLTKKIVLTLEL